MGRPWHCNVCCQSISPVSSMLNPSSPTKSSIPYVVHKRELGYHVAKWSRSFGHLIPLSSSIPKSSLESFFSCADSPKKIMRSRIAAITTNHLLDLRLVDPPPLFAELPSSHGVIQQQVIEDYSLYFLRKGGKVG